VSLKRDIRRAWAEQLNLIHLLFILVIQGSVAFGLLTIFITSAELFVNGVPDTPLPALIILTVFSLDLVIMLFVQYLFFQKALGGDQPHQAKSYLIIMILTVLAYLILTPPMLYS
jgi:hypothetical protein